jgi:hypothetical protein
MRYGQPELLFNKTGVHDVMYRQEQSATAEPAGINDNVLLNTPTEDLVEELGSELLTSARSAHLPAAPTAANDNQKESAAA